MAPTIDDGLLAALRALETALHAPQARGDRPWMETMLHADFVEFGRGGTVWTRDATLDEFADPQAAAAGPSIHAQDFALHCLADGLALLTYRSAHVATGGRHERWSLRSSLWQRGPSGAWQLRFHQGTPTEGPR